MNSRVKTGIVRALIVFISLAGLSSVAAPVWGQQNSVTPRWGPAERVGLGWFPSLAVDLTGRTHLTWYGGYEDDHPENEELTLSDLYMYSAKPLDGTWSDPIDFIFTGEGGYTIRNAIDVSSDGILYAMYRSYTKHRIASAPVDKANDANHWTQVTDFGNTAYYLDMEIDRNNVIHAISSEQGVNLAEIDTGNLSYEAIIERFPCAMCADLIYRRSEDGGRTWSTPVNLSKTLAGSERPDVFEGNSGRLYVTWDEGSDWYIHSGDYEDVRFVYSDDGGYTWSDPVILSGDSPTLHPTQFAMTEMFDGSLLGVWRYGSDDDNHIYFQISKDLGKTWTDPEAIPYVLTDNVNDSILDKYDLVTDLNGSVHLVAVGIDDTTMQGPAVYHFEYRQGRWLVPDRIYYDSKIHRPEWPSIVVGPRNDLHVAWFIRVGDRKNAADVGSLYVYYAERSGTQPDNPVLVAYAPTMTVAPPATQVPTFQPTVTVAPTVAPIDANVQVTMNRDLYATQTLLGAVLAVGVLCVVVLFILGIRPRF